MFKVSIFFPDPDSCTSISFPNAGYAYDYAADIIHRNKRITSIEVIDSSNKLAFRFSRSSPSITIAQSFID